MHAHLPPKKGVFIQGNTEPATRAHARSRWSSACRALRMGMENKYENWSNSYLTFLALRFDQERNSPRERRLHNRRSDLDRRLLRVRTTVRAIHPLGRVHPICADPHMPRSPRPTPMAPPEKRRLNDQLLAEPAMVKFRVWLRRLSRNRNRNNVRFVNGRGSVWFSP